MIIDETVIARLKLMPCTTESLAERTGMDRQAAKMFCARAHKAQLLTRVRFVVKGGNLSHVPFTYSLTTEGAALLQMPPEERPRAVHSKPIDKRAPRHPWESLRYPVLEGRTSYLWA